MNKEMARKTILEGLEVAKKVWLESNPQLRQRQRKIYKNEDGLLKSIESVPYLPFGIKDNVLTSAYLAKTNSFELDDSRFEEIYVEYLLHQNEGMFIYRTVAYLPFVKITNPLKFDNITLLPQSDEYLHFFLNNDSYLRSTYSSKKDIQGLFRLISNPFSGSFIVIESKVSRFEEINNRKQIQSLLTSLVLELGVKHAFEVTPFYTLCYFKEGYECGTHYFHEFVVNRLQPDKTANLKIQDGNKIEKYYRLLDGLETNVLAIPISRLISAFTKESDNDKFIDLMIALEAFFPKVKTEVSYRIALMSTFALKQGPKFFKEMKNLYNDRSNIIHGNSTSTSDNIEKLNTIITQMLNFYLEQTNDGKNLAQVESEIEASIFRYPDTDL